MRNLLTFIAVLGLVSTAACKKDEKKAEAPATDEPKTDEPKGDEPKDEPKADDPTMVNKMEHCPCSVEGAETKVEDGEGVVIVTVTGKDEAATTEIRKRATHLAGLNDADTTETKHSGSGTGGGTLGKCPVVLGAAKVAAEDVEGGTKITMTPTKEGGLAALSQMAKDRAESMAGAGHDHDHGTGGGGGHHHGAGGGGGGGGEGGGEGGGGGGGGDEGKKSPEGKKAPEGKKGPDAGATKK